jgi:hypothetical protein
MRNIDLSMIQSVALLEVFPIILPVVQMEEFDRQELEIGDKSIPWAYFAIIDSSVTIILK